MTTGLDLATVTRYKCRHGHLLARVLRDADGAYWVEVGGVKHSPRHADDLHIKRRAIGRRTFNLADAMLFSGNVVMPSGELVQMDGSKVLAGCRCHQLVLSLPAMRADADAGLAHCELPDAARRVTVARQ